jgi:hypothetical protein
MQTEKYRWPYLVRLVAISAVLPTIRSSPVKAANCYLDSEAQQLFRQSDKVGADLVLAS